MTIILKLIGFIRPWHLSLACVLVAFTLAVALSHLFWWWHTGAIPDGLTVVAGGVALVITPPLAHIFVAAVYNLQASNDELEVTRDALAALNRELEDRVHSRTVALREARDAAERANTAKSIFLANMSHELRTPLNGILGYAEMMMHRETLFPDAPTEKLDEYVAAIHSSGQHLNAMVADLLDLSKIEFERYDLSLAPISVATVLRESVHMLEKTARDRGQRIDLRLPDAMPDLMLDAQAIRQIVTNILSNALKYSHDGQEVTVSVRHVPGRIEIVIADRGIGMSARAVAEAPVPFSRFSDAHIASGESIGLGLSIVGKLCDLLGGTLTLDSVEGRGTTVIASIPAEEAPAEADTVASLSA